ncbi:two-partner secretion domain-containing protein [Nostoc sp. 'Peltigera malacea cyanobiont' DB3992]|uniref:two-partner secretion domain-containing protein n=1 Tax=Nostoc sp. 'Peltigera malacea cyanobiont' DB3992 TaxID=1206980 RepID=UPI000C053A49|nr:S-layer family protein [Nostoc sp. 'Peltigera malacea cyanobiont' DB3992]PHM11604.1 filamentous hemagglutinin [Nostoc sp. 'Peltigera malacea cyanobiont' DB3992]
MATCKDRNWHSDLLEVFGIIGVLAHGIFCSENHALAQITPDGTLDNNSSIITPNVNIKGLSADRIDGGATRGANLFHSFQEFNVGELQRVYFANPTGISNILTRVTGSNISNILGTLGVDGGANLFFINPNGILFGNNARLDVAGSFVGSTANSFVFGNGLEFSATNPQNPSPLLTVNPSALLFNQLQAGRIENRSIAPTGDNIFGLRVPDGQSLLLVGGEIAINEGKLNAPGGRVELAGIAGEGTVGLNVDGNNLSLIVPNNVAKADISLSNQALVSTSGEGGGAIQVWGKGVTVNGGSQIEASTLGALPGKGLSVNASESVQVVGESPTGIRSGLFAETFGTGDAGNLTINTRQLQILAGGKISSSTTNAGVAGNLTVNASESLQIIGIPDNPNLGSSGMFAASNGVGDAGDITINTRQLLIQNGAGIITDNEGKGVGGSITVNAESVQLVGTAILPQFPNRWYPSKISSNAYSTGPAGKITINTNQLLIQDGAAISARTNGSGAGGSLTINASQSVKLIGSAINSNSLFPFPSSLLTQTSSTGTAGDLAINTNQLIVRQGQLSASTFGQGNAGNINIETVTMNIIDSQVGSSVYRKGFAGNLTIHAAESVEISGKIKSFTSNLENPAGLFAQVNPRGEGRGGNLTIETKRLSVSHGGKVQVATFGQGDAGNLTIRASEVEVFDTPVDNLFATGINAGIQLDADETVIPPRGNGGDLTIETDRLSVRGGAIISVGTAGVGNAGKLRIYASKSVEVVGKSPNGNFNSQISAAVKPEGTGSGGSLKIETGQMIVRDGGEVTVSSTGAGTAGDLEIQARSLSLDNQGAIAAITRAGNGGNITLKLQDLLLLRNHSQISTTAGSSEFGGNGGNLMINSPFIVAVPKENSDISANAFTGTGGKVDITTNGIFGILPQKRLTQNSDITASSELGVSGQVTINSPDTDPSRGLTQLPSNLVDASQQIAQGCTPRRQQTASRFIATGRGGLPHSPNEPLRGRAVITGWVDLPAQATAITDKSSTASMTKSTDPIVEAQGWIVDGNGNIMLVAQSVQSSFIPSAMSCSQ